MWKGFKCFDYLLIMGAFKSANSEKIPLIAGKKISPDFPRRISNNIFER